MEQSVWSSGALLALAPAQVMLPGGDPVICLPKGGTWNRAVGQGQQVSPGTFPGKPGNVLPRPVRERYKKNDKLPLKDFIFYGALCLPCEASSEITFQVGNLRPGA